MIDIYNNSVQVPTHIEYVITIDKRKIPTEVKQQAFSLMNQLEGWCSFEKAAILIDFILKSKPETIVEIGVYGGKSLVPMAYALEINGKGQIYGIDPWESSESLKGIKNSSSEYFWGTYVDHSAVMQNLINKISQFKLNNRITLIRSSSVEAPPIEDIDILHIDGNHSAEASYIDVTKWTPLVKKGGLIVLDDMTWYEENAYTQARSIEYLNTHCAKIAEFKGENVWGMWKKL
jgi:predicted O-methyltransferase YrrM